MREFNIIVTAGGVTEKIDSVRKITNSSSGKLGILIANKLAEKYTNANITVIGSKRAFQDNIVNNKIEKITIESTNDLEKEVTLALQKSNIDIFIHSMAVADYTTESVIDFDKFSELISNGCSDIDKAISKSKIDTSNKMSSSLNMMLKMKKTPKIIKLIKEISPKTFLVGFKLLDNVTEEQLFNVGFELLRKNRCNLVIANDIANIRKGNHKALIIYPEKSYDIIEGKENIANELVKLIDKRAFVKHPHSIQLDNRNCISSHNEELNKAFIQIKNTGEELYKEGFLPVVTNHERTDKEGTYGNISVKLSTNNILITSRNVHKGKLKPEDISYVQTTEQKQDRLDENVYANVYYRSKLKPSIDTAIHLEIYKLTRGNAIIHIHTNKVFLGYPYIDEQFPCGSMEEKDAIIKALKRGHKDIAELGYTHVVQMKKHGLIIIGDNLDDCKEKLHQLFNETPYINTQNTCTDSNIDSEVLKHIKDVNANFITMRGSNLYNLELNNNIIGCVWELHEENCMSFAIYTKLNCRKGLHIVENYLKLYNKKYFLYTTPDCQIADFYKNKYGFKDIYKTNNTIILMKNI